MDNFLCFKTKQKSSLRGTAESLHAEKEFWRMTDFVKQQAIFHVSKHVLHEVGHFPGVLMEVDFFFFTEGTRMCVSDLIIQGKTHLCVCCKIVNKKRKDRKDRAGPQKGKPEPSGVVAVGFVRKAGAFSPKMILLSAILDCLYLLPLVSKWTENCQTGSFVVNLFDLLLWDSFLLFWHTGEGDTIGTNNCHVAFYFLNNAVPSFTVCMDRRSNVLNS